MHPPSKRPNFLIVVADDLGYSDVSPFGGEIDTPTIQSLAEEGVRLTNFHTASACSPTRAMLLSGTDHHIAGLGQMDDFMADYREIYRDRPGFEGYLNFKVAAMSEVLQDAGYFTAMSGKWHLGLKKEHAPHARGFERSFAFLPGSGNHYNYEPQSEPGRQLPEFMRSDGWWMEDDKPIDRQKDLPDDFYSSTFFTDRMLNFLESRSEEQKEKPFLGYLAFTAPHWPLQAPQKTINKYRNVYDGGPDALRQRRLQRLTQLGLVSADVEAAPMTGPLMLDDEWDKKTDAEKLYSARTMEVYAAMVDEIDQNLSRLVSYLSTSGELDNTFILFMSDNGAEGAIQEAFPTMGDEPSIAEILKNFYDNRVENVGNADSWAWYGPRWACASMAPSRGYKTWITEGGIRCPCIIRYPPLGVRPYAHTDAFSTVMDIFPTMLDLAGAPAPHGTFRGREIVQIRGVSWVPHLTSPNLDLSTVHPADTYVTGWELFGLRAIRRGPWKALWMPPPRGKAQWELYNVVEDPGEIHNRAQDRADILITLMEDWDGYYKDVGMFEYGHDFWYVQQ